MIKKKNDLETIKFGKLIKLHSYHCRFLRFFLDNTATRETGFSDNHNENLFLNFVIFYLVYIKSKMFPFYTVLNKNAMIFSSISNEIACRTIFTLKQWAHG